MSAKPAKIPRWINVFLVAAFCALIFFNLKTFSLNEQITALIGCFNSVDPVALFVTGHPHATRYLIFWPFVEISKAFGTDLTYTFSWMVLAQLCLLCWIQAKTVRNIRPADSGIAPWDFTIFLTLWFTISLFMNGRLVTAFLGTGVVAYGQIAFLAKSQGKSQFAIIQLLGLFLCSVSSGVFTAHFLEIAFFLITLFFRKDERNITRVDIAVIGVIFMAVMGPLLKIYIHKNLSFFDDSIARMMLHGPPRYLYELGIGILPIQIICYSFVAAVFAGMIGIYMWLAKRNHILRPAILLIGCSAIIGVFGDSTFLTMLPSILLLCIAHFPDARKNACSPHPKLPPDIYSDKRSAA